MTKTLGELFPQEIETAKKKAAAYAEIGPSGAFALSWIRPLISEAEKAWREQDTVAMIRLYPQLKDIAW